MRSCRRGLGGSQTFLTQKKGGELAPTRAALCLGRGHTPRVHWADGIFDGTQWVRNSDSQAGHSWSTHGAACRISLPSSAITTDPTEPRTTSGYLIITPDVYWGRFLAHPLPPPIGSILSPPSHFPCAVPTCLYSCHRTIDEFRICDLARRSLTF